MPLVKQLHRVQEMAVPDFGTLAAREVETKTIIIDEAKVSYCAFGTGTCVSGIHHAQCAIKSMTS